jgi:hypothetical protein
MTLLAAIFAGASKGSASLSATRSSFALDLALITAVIGAGSFLLLAFDFWKAERELIAIFRLATCHTRACMINWARARFAPTTRSNSNGRFHIIP